MTTWVVVADASRARIFSAEGASGPLTEIEDMVHPESRLHEREMASDEPGTTFDRGGQGQHGMGNAVDPKQQEATRFAKEVCEELDSARQAGKYDRLYVIAAPAFLGVIRDTMHDATKKLVAAEVDKNLAAHEVAEIRAHLPEHL